MKNSILFLIVLSALFCSCSKGSCPSTDKKYFMRGVPKAKSLYKGYPSTRGNKCWSR